MTSLVRLLSPLFLALQFLTIIPVSLTSTLRPIDYDRSTGWFPLVGLLVGAPGALAALTLSSHLPSGLLALVVLIVPIVLTGALHLDGFADCCDAMFAPRSKADRLTILKDSRVGVFGATGLIVVLLARYAALTLASPSILPALALAAPCLARWSLVLSLRFVPAAIPGKGLGALFAERRDNGPIAAATLIAMMAAWVSFGPAGAFALVGTVGVTALVGSLTIHNLGGATGDVYGATSECVELCLQLGCAVAVVWR